MPHYEFQSVSRMKENFTYGLTGRNWKLIDDLCKKSLLRGESDDNTQSKIRRQFFTLLAVLTQILAQAIQQLYQLKQIYREGQDSLDLLRNINRGINDSLILIRTVYPNADPGLFKEWDRMDRALRGIQELYGGVAPSPEAKIQKDTDQNIAEAITLNNSIYKYTKDVDEIGEEIKRFSHAVSPGGAQKLTAQSLGVMLNVLNQTLRTHATGLKIQAHSLAIQNYKEKEATKKQIESSNTLSASMKSQDVSFRLPRL